MTLGNLKLDGYNSNDLYAYGTDNETSAHKKICLYQTEEHEDQPVPLKETEVAYGQHASDISSADQTIESDKKTILKKYSPKHPEATEIANQMKLSPKLEGLATTQKDKLVDECIKAYTESVAVFEDVMGEVSSNHPHSKEFANEMVQRINKIIEAYQQILIEDSEDDKHATPLVKELKIKRGASQEYFRNGTGTGSVGANQLAVQNALKSGELREQLALIYATLWTALPKVFEKPDVVGRINSKLDENLSGFRLNTEEIDKKREQARGGSALVATFFSQSKPLADFRNTDGRIGILANPETAPKAKYIKDLTIREYRASVDPEITYDEFKAMKQGEAKGKKWGERRIQWIRGRDIFRVNEDSDFYKRSIAFGKLPIVNGPSGAVDGYLHGINYLNMHEYVNKMTLALTGWMVKSGDHTYHEIKEAGTWHGLEYTPGPDSFENVYPDDPNFQEEIKALMKKQGKELPGEYLKDHYQLKMAAKLGFITYEQQT